ncbi:hypothetical protein CC79DRAFT_1365012 [Sarocladium strictum]
MADLVQAPLTQVAEPLDPSEPYHDVEQVSTSIVSQQYSSPDYIEPLEMMCNNYAATGIFQTPQLASNTSQLTPNPMTIRTEAPLVNGPVTANCLQLATHPMTGPAHKLYVAPVQDFNQEVEGMSFLNSAFVQGPTQEPEHVGFATRKRPAGSPLLQEQAIIFDVVSPCSKSKRGPFRDESLRQQTADTRRHGACIECGRQRIRCMPNVDDPLGPCQGCLRNLPTKVPRIPCLRYRITDVKLSKTGQVPGFEWTRRWSHARKDIKHWASEAVKTIYISEGLSNTQMKFRVKEFVPQTGDKLERSWVHQGTRQSVPIPPFALTRLEDAKQAYEQHITATESGALKRVLGLSSPLLRETYEFAANLRRTRGLDEGSKTLLDITFQLWMVVRFSTMSTWIVGDETLGMPRNILDTSPNPGKIPLPPVLGAQLDSILIHEFQETIRRKLLRQLDKAFRKYKHASWLVTYLVSFILLHNAALITAHDAKYAQKHGMKRRFARERSVADYHMGATIILAHFHNCTRNHPFTDQCNEEELKNLCQMTDDQIRFIRDTRLYIKIYGEEWDRVREEGLYEHDFYFVSQLYQEPWSPHTFNVDGNYSGSEGSSERSASVE